jgi:hypothetical protein
MAFRHEGKQKGIHKKKICQKIQKENSTVSWSTSTALQQVLLHQISSPAHIKNFIQCEIHNDKENPEDL